ncbi:MAG: pyridoxal phosphate-dependent aminotransferase [Clostridiales bacterium]|nr:pyridoxal phosphate-dependent aminotransferase [Clostridiales bacterium]
MKELSLKAKQIQPSVTLEIDAKAKKMKAEGIDVVGFGAGEPDFDTPQFIIEAADQAMRAGKTRYTPAAGTLELRKAICEKLKRENGLEYQPSQIVVSNGAKHSLYNTMQAICNPGDEVLLPGPYWVSYYEQIKMAGATPVIVMAREEDGFTLSAEQLEAAITPSTKALVLCSPSNPTGAVYSREQLQAIADMAVKHGIYVISDEIYEHLLYDGREHVSIASLGDKIKEQTIVINGMSKAYCMTGWRIGFTASSQQVASVMANYQSHATSNPNSIAQAASVAALAGGKEKVKDMVAEFARRRDYMTGRINEIQGLSARRPQGAFYLFVNISGVLGKAFNGETIHNALEFSASLLQNSNVAVVPGEAFGDGRYVRLSYATSMENIQKGLDRIEAFVKALV